MFLLYHKVMNKKTARIVLDIEWESPNDSDLPSLWNWSLIKYPLDLTSVKYIGVLVPGKPEKAENWIGN